MTIGYIHFYVWVALILLVTGLKAEGFWKGMCGGNGVPQSGEFQQYVVVYAVLFHIGQVFFLHHDPQYAFLVMLMIYGATGKIDKLNAFQKPKQ